VRIVVGITGSSSPMLGIRTLEVLRDAGVETHLVVSAGAQRTIKLETDRTLDEVRALAHTVHDARNMAAPVSSGSFPTDGMVIAPCSMKALAAVAYSFATDLVVRAADVTLKEGRTLVVVPRETPLHLGHLRNLVRAAEIGAVVLPPVIGHYYRPGTVDDVVDHIVGKILDQFGIEHNLYARWGGAAPGDDEG
jgi:polyprenyl P-hydroxybenzoate/phenylacrylic acid decarboxylase-like protein